MVDLSLVNYIRQLLQMGYDINSIRNRLITSGYDINSVNEAVNYLNQPAPENAVKTKFSDVIKSRRFFFISISIFAIILISILVLFLSGGEEEQIGVFITVSTYDVVPGENLEFTKAVSNLGDSGMVSLSYEITNPSGSIITSKQESFSTLNVPRSTQIMIPETAFQGSYSLKVSAVYAGQTAEKTSTFTVSEQEVIEEEIIEPETEQLPDNDKDGEPDTADLDDDNDGIPDDEDPYPFDHDNDGIPDKQDTDDDNDGILDKFDSYPYDRDNDGIPDISDTDNDNDGIPDDEDPYPFDYDNDGTMDKDENDDLSRSYEFPKQQEEQIISSKCVNDRECNDFDICTRDRCVEGTCEYERIDPCCGDSICEAAETEQSCPQDCREIEISAVDEGAEEIAEIMEIAETNPESAASRCSLIERTTVSDSCFSELAKKATNSNFCSRIRTEPTMNACYMYFVMNKDDSSVCPKITDPYLQNSCYTIIGLKESQR